MPRGVYIHNTKGENSPRWKGGKPKCLDCDKRISWISKRCMIHAHAYKWANHISTFDSAEAKRQWRQNNLEKVRYQRHTYKMRKKNAPGSHTLEEWLDLKIKYNFMCLCCKKFEPEIKLTEDHIIPLKMGGSDTIDNIQPLCNRCNTSKYTKTIDYTIKKIEEEVKLFN